MNKPWIEAALAESVRDVLEKMFFMDVADVHPGEGPEVGIAAELTFDGDPAGSFRLVLDETAARSAAADFLGEDQAELSDEHMHDVICELCNMICGSVLSRIESSSTFRLSKPEIVLIADAPGATAGFQAAVGGGFMRAEIRMERTVCPGTSEYAS